MEGVIKEKNIQSEFTLKKLDQCNTSLVESNVTITKQNTQIEAYKTKYTPKRDIRLFGFGLGIGSIITLLIFR